MPTSQTANASILPLTRAGGYCRRCGKEHLLGPGNTISIGLELMQQFQEHGTIELFPAPSTGDGALLLDYLFGPARGKMFGLLECRAGDGTTVLLRAFSGQYNARWLVEGWVPPLFKVDDFISLTRTRAWPAHRSIETTQSPVAGAQKKTASPVTGTDAGYPRSVQPP